MPRKLLVADAGPLIALAVANVLQAAVKHFALLVPQTVLDECVADPYAPGATDIAHLCKQGTVQLVPNADIAPLDAAFAMGLGSGEAAVLAYAAQHNLVALIDERRARSMAHRLHVSVVGSGAVLLALKSNGLIDTIRPALAGWAAQGYHVSDALRIELVKRAGE